MAIKKTTGVSKVLREKNHNEIPVCYIKSFTKF